MKRAIGIGILCGLAVYAIRFMLAFISLVREQPQFGGMTSFPLSAIWVDAVRLLPWFLLAACLSAVITYNIQRRAA